MNISCLDPLCMCWHLPNFLSLHSNQGCLVLNSLAWLSLHKAGQELSAVSSSETRRYKHCVLFVTTHTHTHAVSKLSLCSFRYCITVHSSVFSLMFMNVTYLRAEQPVSHCCSHDNGLLAKRWVGTGDVQRARVCKLVNERAELKVGQLLTEFRLLVLVLASAHSSLIVLEKSIEKPADGGGLCTEGRYNIFKNTNNPLLC